MVFKGLLKGQNKNSFSEILIFIQDELTFNLINKVNLICSLNLYADKKKVKPKTILT